jgi:hypothetical protein
MNELQLNFNRSYETAIYVSDAGYIVIKQSDWPNEDQQVLLAPDQARKLLKQLPDFLTDADYLWENPEASE